MNSFLTGSVGEIPHHVLEGGPSRDEDIQLVDVDVTMEGNKHVQLDEVQEVGGTSPMDSDNPVLHQA